ncbi:MAG: S24 family peptidase [Pseudomonadota bacterium]
MSLGHRILSRLTDLGLSQSELGRRAGVTQGTIAHLISGRSTGTKHLLALARELRTTPAFLLSETDDPNEGVSPPPSEREIAEHFDLVEISEIDVAYGMGESFIDDHVELQIHHFPRLWVESITSSPPSALTIARGRGDSMDPTIRDRDMVIFDRSRRVLDEADAIWVLTVQGMGMIKRLRQRGSNVVIQSDNDRVSDEVVLADDVTLIGRVVFIGRRT